MAKDKSFDVEYFGYKFHLEQDDTGAWIATDMTEIIGSGEEVGRIEKDGNKYKTIGYYEEDGEDCEIRGGTVRTLKEAGETLICWVDQQRNEGEDD